MKRRKKKSHPWHVVMKVGLNHKRFPTLKACFDWVWGQLLGGDGTRAAKLKIERCECGRNA